MAGGIPNLGSLSDYASEGAGGLAGLESLLGISSDASSISSIPGLGNALDAVIPLLLGDPNASIPDFILGPLAAIPGLEGALQNALGLQGLPRGAKTGAIGNELEQSPDPGDQLLGYFINQELGGSGQVLSSKVGAAAAPIFADIIQGLTGQAPGGEVPVPGSTSGAEEIPLPSGFGGPLDVTGIGGAPEQAIASAWQNLGLPSLSDTQVAQLYPQLSQIAEQYAQQAQSNPTGAWNNLLQGIQGLKPVVQQMNAPAPAQQPQQPAPAPTPAPQQPSAPPPSQPQQGAPATNYRTGVLANMGITPQQIGQTSASLHALSPSQWQSLLQSVEPNYRTGVLAQLGVTDQQAGYTPASLHALSPQQWQQVLQKAASSQTLTAGQQQTYQQALQAAQAQGTPTPQQPSAPAPTPQQPAAPPPTAPQQPAQQPTQTNAQILQSMLGNIPLSRIGLTAAQANSLSPAQLAGEEQGIQAITSGQLGATNQNIGGINSVLPQQPPPVPINPTNMGGGNNTQTIPQQPPPPTQPTSSQGGGQTPPGGGEGGGSHCTCADVDLSQCCPQHGYIIPFPLPGKPGQDTSSGGGSNTNTNTSEGGGSNTTTQLPGGQGTNTNTNTNTQSLLTQLLNSLGINTQTPGTNTTTQLPGSTLINDVPVPTTTNVPGINLPGATGAVGGSPEAGFGWVTPPGIGVIQPVQVGQVGTYQW